MENQVVNKQKTSPTKNGKMDSYVQRIKTQAEHIAKDIFPEKALELDELINSESFSTENLSKLLDISDLPKPEDFLVEAIENKKEKNGSPSKKRKTDPTAENGSDSSTQTGTKVIIFPNGGIASNAKIVAILQAVKPFIVHFLDSAAILKLWIQVLIPQVEDFKAELSLQIQEETLSEIRAIESEVATYLDHIYKYYAMRGRLIAKTAKYPHVMDLKQSCCELDEKMFMTGRLVANELRNHYTVVHDILIKNMEKIKKPRAESMNTMY